MNTIQMIVGVGEDKNGQALENSLALIDTMRAYLATTFGGYTEQDTSGGWCNPQGRLVQEQAKLYTIFSDKTEAESVAAAAYVKDCMQQHSVVLVYNNQPQFVA